MENEDNHSYNYVLLNKSTVGPPCLGFCICRFNRPWIENIRKKNPESSKKQNLNFLHAGNYLQSIYIVFTATGRPHFIALPRYCTFCKLKVCGNPASSKSIGAIFPIAFAHFMSLCYILVIFTIFQTFSLLLYFSW